MRWPFGRSEDPKSDGDDVPQARDTLGELDLNQLLSEAPPPPTVAEPPPALYVDPAESVDPAPRRSDYTSVDLGELRRMRRDRERSGGLRARLRRGDWSGGDVPGVNLIGRLVLRLGQASVRPWELAMENLGTLFTGTLTLVGLGIATWLLVRLAEWYLQPLF